MVNSMTGFGRGEVARDGFKATFELSSVNSRYLEVSLRLPRWLLALEAPLRAIVDARLSRGKVYGQLSWERTEWAPTQTFNEPLADWYIETLKGLAARHQMSAEFSVGALVGLSDLWSVRNESPDEQIEALLREALTSALDQLQRSRESEGQALAADLTQRLARVDELLGQIRARAAEVPQALREKLTARVTELFGNGGYDPQRLAQEVAYMAERADITEECVRLDVHVRQFKTTLAGREAAGRRLNFLTQEMNREANTIGSKSASWELSTLVVELKEELERIREQVQNIE
ncbi:MAG: YicC/YloC family endoribonuclease [Candidatus Zixiibacteriota bacterium]